ncbi:MAG: hypothetical protein AAF974_11585 [Cyanobacteria bacterium P01_E01_bin.34]
MKDISVIGNDVSHIEIASVNFDQWILTIALRIYDLNQSVKGMVHGIFKGVRGFRCLDEGDMLKFAFPREGERKYVKVISEGGWLSQEIQFGNIVATGQKEYLVATDNECICILACEHPVLVKEL